MNRSQARWLLALACIVTLAGCAPSTEPRSGDTRTEQERERTNEPSGMRGGGGGGGY